MSGATIDAMVGAVLVETIRRPAFVAFYVACGVLFALVLGTVVPSHLVGAAGGAIVGIVTALISVMRLRHQFFRIVEAKGYRPGAEITADWQGDEFIVSTPTSTTRYRYADAGRVRRRELAVTVAQLHSRQHLVMPAAIAPPACTVLLQTAR